MSDFLAFLLVLLAVIVIGALGAVGIIIILVLTTACYLAWLPFNYFLAMKATVGSDSGSPGSKEDGLGKAILHRRAHTDQQVALPSYFFGPASADMESIVRSTMQRCTETFRSSWKWITNVFEFDTIYGFIAIVGFRSGLVAGSAAGAVATSIVALIHLAVTATTVSVATGAAVLLRGADAFKRFISGVHMSCPTCGNTVHPYPAYRCPRCDALHRDIRPGSHGVITRICNCGCRMPTSLLTGTGKLVAACSACGTPLPSKFGSVGEIVIPFFGGTNVGKTQLMYNVILAINQLLAEEGGTVEVGKETRFRLEAIGADLTSIGTPSRTLPQIPEAHVLYIRLGASERLIYLFDAAGEIYSKQSNLAGVRYLNVARTLVFVADPLASDVIWGRLPAEQQHDLATVRSRASEIELAYEVTREHMRDMTRRRRLRLKKRVSRLAFVISKADALTGTAAASIVSAKSARQLAMDRDGLDLGNLAREAEQSFSAVEYFQTSAITDNTGEPDKSIAALTRWIMWGEDIRLETPYERA
jgi:hypothetical protein